MNAKVFAVPTAVAEAQETTVRILEEALAEAKRGEMVEIVMVGFMSDGNYVVRTSPGSTHLKRIGALEQVKFDLMVAHSTYD